MTKKIYFGDSIFNRGREHDLEAWRIVGDAFGFSPVRAHENPEEVCLPNVSLSDMFRVGLNPRLRKLRRIAILTEPTVVLPHLGWGLWRSVFQEIFWFGRTSGLGPFYPRPYEFPADIVIPGPENRSMAAVLVNANKVSMSTGELYTLRRLVIDAIECIHVYGPGWNDKAYLRSFRVVKELMIALFNPFKVVRGSRKLFVLPRNYHGVVSDKILATSGYKVALVIENSFELVTEKIFDAWLAGCIPVYVGPDLRDLGVPDALYLKALPNLVSVSESIELALQVDHDKFLNQLRDWIRDSPDFTKWRFLPAYSNVFGSPEPLTLH